MLATNKACAQQQRVEAGESYSASPVDLRRKSLAHFCRMSCVFGQTDLFFLATDSTSSSLVSSAFAAPAFSPAAMFCALSMPTRAQAISVPVFLAPAFAESSISLRVPAPRTFSTSPASSTRRTTGPNKQRGVSAIRSKPPKHKTEVYKYDLPKPVDDPQLRALFKMNKNHGLWGFFNEKRQPLTSPGLESAHGRSWNYAELARKSFEDLHRLYWTCILEGNQISTRGRELTRARAGFGKQENVKRLKTVCEPLPLKYPTSSMMSYNFHSPI